MKGSGPKRHQDTLGTGNVEHSREHSVNCCHAGRKHLTQSWTCWVSDATADSIWQDWLSECTDILMPLSTFHFKNRICV